MFYNNKNQKKATWQCYSNKKMSPQNHFDYIYQKSVPQ